MSNEQQIHNLIARYTHYVDSSSHWPEIFHTMQRQILSILRKLKTEGNKFENSDKRVRQNGNETFHFDEL